MTAGVSTAAPERGSGRQAGHGCDYRSGVHVLHTLLQIGAVTVPFISCERLFLSHGAQPEDRLTLRRIICGRKHKGRGRCDPRIFPAAATTYHHVECSPRCMASQLCDVGTHASGTASIRRRSRTILIRRWPRWSHGARRLSASLWQARLAGEPRTQELPVATLGCKCCIIRS